MALTRPENVVYGPAICQINVDRDGLLITLSPEVANDLSATSKEGTGHFVLFGVPHRWWFTIGRL